MFFVPWAPSHLAAGPHFPQYFPSSWYALCYSKARPSVPGHSTYSSYLWTLLMEINRTRQKPGLGSVLPSAPQDFKQCVQKCTRSCRGWLWKSSCEFKVIMKLHFLLYDRYFTFPFVCPVACPKLCLLRWDESSASQSFPQAGWASVAPFLAKSTSQISKCLVFILLHFFVPVHKTLCLVSKQWVNIFHRDFLFFNKRSNFLK